MAKFNAEARYFLVTNLAAGATSAAGALSLGPSAELSPDSALTLYLFTAASIGVTTCASLSLIYRAEEDSIRVVVGRFLMSVLLTVFGTRVLMGWFDKWPSTDVLSIGQYSIFTCILAYTVGHSTITYAVRHPSRFRDAILNLVLRGSGSETKEPPK